MAEYSAPDGHLVLGWRRSDGSTATVQITDAGRQAIGYGEPRNAVDPAAPTGTAPTSALAGPHSESLVAPTTSPVGDCDEGDEGAGSPSRTPSGASRQFRLREAAQSVLAAWGTPEQRGLAAAIDALQAALASSSPASKDAATRAPRLDTKQATVLALLRRPEGASGPQLIEATGWAPHTVRGFLAGLGRKGIAVTLLERVRQVGPNKAGAKGSYSIYRIAEVG